MLDNHLLLKVLSALATCHNVAIFSMDVEVFLQVGDLFEAFLAAENGANVRLLPGVSPHMVEQTLYSLEEFATARLIAGIVSHCF